MNRSFGGTEGCHYLVDWPFGCSSIRSLGEVNCLVVQLFAGAEDCHRLVGWLLGHSVVRSFGRSSVARRGGYSAFRWG